MKLLLNKRKCWGFEYSTLNIVWVLAFLLFILCIAEAEGWAMPTAEKRMRIAVPATTFSDKFVNLQPSVKNETRLGGFCIDAFQEVTKTLANLNTPIHLYYEFVHFLGSHDQLVYSIAEGKFDAAVGDIFTLADRWKAVEFTTPFTESGEIIQHNYTRVVVVVWLFVVLIVTQTCTANLSSILTISRLDPNVDSLKKGNAIVACYRNNAVKNYLVNVLHFREENIRDDIATQSQYLEALKNGSISAAFLEAPYAKALVNEYCDQLTVTGPTYKFGGFGFIFRKGSAIADDVSQAILKLIEDGTLETLEDQYFARSTDCSNFQTAKKNDSLTLKNFWGLYIFYIVTTTVCLLLFIIHSLKNQRRHPEVQVDYIMPTRVSAWKKILPLTRFLNNAAVRDRGRAPNSSHAPSYIEMH